MPLLKNQNPKKDRDLSSFSHSDGEATSASIEDSPALNLSLVIPSAASKGQERRVLLSPASFHLSSFLSQSFSIDRSYLQGSYLTVYYF